MTSRARRISGLMAACALLAAAGAPSATATNFQRLQVTLHPVAGPVDGNSRAMALHFRLSRWTDDGRIGTPAAEDRFSLPPGFVVHPHALPYCDQKKLARKGPAACRAARIGSGVLKMAAMTVNPTPPVYGSLGFYNARPVHGHPTALTYAAVTQPIHAEFWFPGSVVSTGHGEAIDVREARLHIYGVPLTVLQLDFDLGSAGGHAFLTGPKTCGSPASRVFALHTTFYNPFTGLAPAGPDLATAEPASC
jgi:hypothetical protein